MIRLLCGLALITTFAPSASAQVPAQTRAEAPDLAVRACSYDECALRIEPRLFSGPVVLRGRSEVPLGRLGLFSDNLSRAVADNEIAYGYARDAEKVQGASFAMSLVGTALLVYSTTYLQVDRAFDNNGFRSNNQAGVLAVGLGGTALAIAGGALQLKSRQSQSRAVWEYNRGLASAP